MKLLIASIASVVLLSTGLYVALERPAWLPDAVASPAEQSRVLVFLVGGPAGVDHVRKAVSPDRIVYATADAIALREGRIVASNAAAVSEPMNEAGWRDRPIEMFHVQRADPLRRRSTGGEGAADVDPDRMAKLRSLVNKPTLTYGEQIFVLQAMNDGIAF